MRGGRPKFAGSMKWLPSLPRVAFALLVALALTARGQDPAAPKKNGYTVNVAMKVNELGETEEVEVTQAEDPTPGRVLSKMALAMAVKTNMPIQQKDGKPIRYTARVPFFFPIEDDEGPEANLGPKPVGKADESRQPSYPPEMLAKKEVGGAILEFVVDTQGSVTKLRTLRASHPEFEKASVDAVATWKFRPALKDGAPIDTRWRVAIVFDLDEKMADLAYRVAPRPSLGSFMVVHDSRVTAAAPAEAAAGAASPAVTVPVPAPAPATPKP